MVNSAKKPILVTGSHRSGSTWTGRMLSLCPSVTYIHEPFNIELQPSICKAKFDYWFQYICHENEFPFLNDMEDCLQFRYPIGEKIKLVKSLRVIAQLSQDYMYYAKSRMLGQRALIKDPIALFSAEWLAKRFNMDVVVLIRHPAAFVSSLKKNNFSHNFRHFLKQPLLMEHHLSEFRSEIEEYTKIEKDVIDQGILLWNIFHHMILHYRKNHPDWIFIRHEDLSRCPVENFHNIYNNLGLNFSARIKKEIEAFSSIKSTQENAHLVQRIQRNSEKNIFIWKSRLTPNEVCRIQEKTHKIASNFYTEQDWIES